MQGLRSLPLATGHRIIHVSVQYVTLHALGLYIQLSRYSNSIVALMLLISRQLKLVLAPVQDSAVNDAQYNLRIDICPKFG